MIDSVTDSVTDPLTPAGALPWRVTTRAPAVPRPAPTASAAECAGAVPLVTCRAEAVAVPWR